MKNEIEKRQKEDDNSAKANQSTEESLKAEPNGTDDTTEPALTNGVNTNATKLVAC